jgi:hypothetical protein
MVMHGIHMNTCLALSGFVLVCAESEMWETAGSRF